MPAVVILLLLAALGGLLGMAGSALVRVIGADWRTARRLAGAQSVSIADAVARARSGEPAGRPVRVAGRVRCVDPIVLPGGERLALLHRDIDVHLASGRWQPIERIRESRAIDLWERGTAIALDPTQVAEPIVAIPQVWQGSPAELPEALQRAVDQVGRSSGPITEARSVTRTILLVDELLVLGQPGIGPGGEPAMLPPEGGLIVSNLALDDAMRILGGRHRRLLTLGLGTAAVGAVLALVGLVGAAVAAGWAAVSG